MIQYFNFSDKTVLITGAAGVLGYHIAKGFASAGAGLVLVDLSLKKERLEEITEEFTEKFKNSFQFYTLDIRNEKEVLDLEYQLQRDDIQIDILVNNAGANIIKSALLMTGEEWDVVVDTNMKGTFLMSKHIGRTMLRTLSSGVIVNVSSQHGVVGNEDRTSYCASKAGIINLTRALAIEWARHSVRVNCVSPTFILSSKNQEVLNSPLNLKKFLKKIPLGRYCVPEDVTNGIMFLASPLAGMVTGHNLVIDGGYTIQ